jgi:CDGSH-type Zn-finger protein
VLREDDESGTPGARPVLGPFPMADAETKITPYRDGPYLVRGPFSIVDQNGNEIEVKRRVVALCRCGRSQMRPFCDGTHKAIGFRAESGLPAQAELPAALEA